MLILINRISKNVALDGKPHFRTLALLSQGGIHPLTSLLDSYDQNSPLLSLTRTLTIVFTRPRTTSCPQIGPQAQYIYIYLFIYLYTDIYYWAYHPYNSPSNFSSLAPQEEKRISMSFQLPRFYHASSLPM